jgi:hypothetical protein
MYICGCENAAKFNYLVRIPGSFVPAHVVHQDDVGEIQSGFRGLAGALDIEKSKLKVGPDHDILRNRWG